MGTCVVELIFKMRQHEEGVMVGMCTGPALCAGLDDIAPVDALHQSIKMPIGDDNWFCDDVGLL